MKNGVRRVGEIEEGEIRRDKERWGQKGSTFESI